MHTTDATHPATTRAAGPDPETVDPVDQPVDPSPLSTVLRIAAGVGPVLLAASSLAWLAGDDSAQLRGVLQFWAIPATALGAAGVLARLERRAPRARALVTTMLAIGAAAGAAFALEILMVDQFGVERLIRQGTPAAVLTLALPGPLFPLALSATGVLSLRHGTLPRRQAVLLAAAGVLFPLSRIPEVAGLAVLADGVLVAALAPEAVRAWRSRRRVAPVPSPAVAPAT